MVSPTLFAGGLMASPTQISDRRRKMKVRRANPSRRAKLRKGSTPPFPIHPKPADKPEGEN
jgi:hypothetical protein